MHSIQHSVFFVLNITSHSQLIENLLYWQVSVSLCFDRELDEKMRDVFHGYLEERGVNESLFPFLQAWLYVKDHRNLLRWFKSVGTFVHENPSAENTA